MELADLLAQATARMAQDPLQALLSRAQHSIEVDRERKLRAQFIEQSRKQLATGHLSRGEQEAARNAIANWEAQHVWKTVGKTAVFTRHACVCGECHTVFSHWMLEQIHREVPTRKRHTKASSKTLAESSAETEGLKPRVGFQELSVEMCPVCAGKHGVELSAVPAFEVVG